MRIRELDDDERDLLIGTTILKPGETKRYWRDLADLREPIEREFEDDYPGLAGYRGRRLPVDQDNNGDDWNWPCEAQKK